MWCAWGRSAVRRLVGWQTWQNLGTEQLLPVLLLLGAATATGLLHGHLHRPMANHGLVWPNNAPGNSVACPHMPTETPCSSKWKLWTEVPTRPGNPRRAARGTPIPVPRPRFPVPAESGNGGFPDSRFRPSRESGIPVSRPNRESGERELGTSGSGRHPPSADPWQFKKEGGQVRSGQVYYSAEV